MNIIDAVFFRGGKLRVVHSRIISGSEEWLFGVLRTLHSQVLTCGFLSCTGTRIGSEFRQKFLSVCYREVVNLSI